MKFRKAENLAIGEDSAWAIVVANLTSCLGIAVTAKAVSTLAYGIGLAEIDEAVLTAVTADTATAQRVWSKYRLRTAKEVGALLQVTSVERQYCRITDIDAWDESAVDRKKRLAKERQARARLKQAAKAGPRQLTQAELAAAEGISLATWKRRQCDSELNLVTLPKGKNARTVRVMRARVNSVTKNGSTLQYQEQP